MSWTSIAKAIGGPGSLGFLALSCLVGFVLLYGWRKRSTVGRVWLLGTLLLYIVLGCPFVAQSIANSLPPVPSTNVAALGRLDEVIVLGGDNENGRVATTLDVWRSAKPTAVVLLGDALLAQRLTDAGVAPAQLRHDDTPATTRAQMQWIAAEFRTRPPTRAALIASRLQMPRVIELARTYGVHVLFLSSPLDHSLVASGVWTAIPSYGALEVSRDALYERAALSYYRSRGWIRAEP